jgi:hypothetical protein
MTQQTDCRQTYKVISKKTLEFGVSGWRCKKIKECLYCRGVEERKLRYAMNAARATIYVIDKNNWETYRRTLRNNSDIGYISIPQKDGKLVVYSTVEPRCEHTVLDRLSTEQILANRLDDDVGGYATRTGMFAIEKKEEVDEGEEFEINAYIVSFKFKESGEILPSTKESKTIEGMAYISSPYHTITRENIEAHQEHAVNVIATCNIIELDNAVEPVIKEVRLKIKEGDLPDMLNGAKSIDLDGVNLLSDPKKARIALILLGHEKPFPWVQHYREKGLLKQGFDDSASKEADEMMERVFEGIKNSQK